MNTVVSVVAYFLMLSGPFVASYFAVVLDRKIGGRHVKHAYRSECAHCQTVLQWYELVPIVSFLLLRGRCRTCGAAIDPRLFYSELLGFAIFFSVGFHTAQIADSAIQITSLVDISMLVTLAVYLLYLAIFDLFTLTIPGTLTQLFTLAFLLISVFLNGIRLLSPLTRLPQIANLESLIVFFGLAAFIYGVILLTQQKGMGEGDIYVAAVIGLFLGWPLGVVAIYFSVIVGGLIGLAIWAYSRDVKGKIIPFVPLLLLGTSLSIMFGQQFFNFIFNL